MYLGHVHSEPILTEPLLPSKPLPFRRHLHSFADIRGIPLVYSRWKIRPLAGRCRQSWAKRNSTITSVSPCCRQAIPDISLDYIFTDPPFGENIYYADLNQLIEAWHRVRTDPTGEAIIDQAKKRGCPSTKT